MIDYSGKEIKYNGCPGCAYANHEFNLDCGMAYENESFTLSHDWELPIYGFFVICPKRHVEYFNELTYDEINYLFRYVHKTQSYLKEMNICDEFGIVISERKGVHLHVWISPKNQLANEKFKGGIAYIKDYFKYAKENLKTKENFIKIENTVKTLRAKFHNEIK